MEGEFKAGGWHVEKICSLVQCREPLVCFVHGSGPLSTKLYLSAAHRGHFPPIDALKHVLQTDAHVHIQLCTANLLDVDPF